MRPRPREALRRSLLLPVALGALAGVAYAVANRAFDLRTGFGTLPSSLAPVHDAVDLVLPVLVGALLGVSAHYVRVRADLVAAERARADHLDRRLAHVERDQAVWVLSASVLHELRNPIHSLGLLLDELPHAATDVEREELVSRARAQIDRVLARLVDLRRLGAGESATVAPVRVDELVRGLASELQPMAARDGIDLRVSLDGELVARADGAYVRIILENLVANAIESMRGRGLRGHVDLRCERKDGAVELRVADEGPGPEEPAHLFEPLRTEKATGMGMGLSIARALARSCGGDLEHEGGSTFVLTLAAEPAGVPS
jgi:signal transduction histidine kinase